MLTRISNVTSYEHVPLPVPVTNIVHHWKGDHYAARTFGHLTQLQVEEHEERFLERRHRNATSQA